MKITLIAIIAVFALGTGSIHAGVSADATERIKEPAPDPKRKRVGEECKTSDQCQRHHSCEKVGEKKICVAPPRHEIPNT